MSDRNDCFSWTGVALGLASVVMFGFAKHEGQKAKQLEEAQALPSVSGPSSSPSLSNSVSPAANELINFLPVLVAVRGKAQSDEPAVGRISPTKAVLIEETEELSALKQNDKGTWIPEYKIIKHQRNMPKWFIMDDSRAKLGVEEAFDASMLEGTLTTQKQFKEGNSSPCHRLMGRLSGYQPLGVWEMERILPIGTAVTVVGELAKSSDGKDEMVVRKPSGPLSGRPFYITSKSFEELQECLRLNTGACQFLGIGLGTVSVVFLGIQLWRHVRSTLRYRRIRKQLAEEEKRRRIDRTILNGDGYGTHYEDERKGKCIVCWDRNIDAVFIPCGHLCACLKCCLELTRCPVCRHKCKVHKIYLA